MNGLAPSTAVETGEAAAYADMYRCAIAAGHGARYGLSVREDDAATLLMATGMPVWMFNRLLRLGESHPTTESAIAEAARVFADAGVQCAIQPSPATGQSEEIADWVKALGATPGRTWAKMHRDARPPASVSTTLRIDEATEAQAADVGRIVCAAFGMPAGWEDFIAAVVGAPCWRAYLAFDDDRPVAAGLLHVQDGIGWLGAGTTLEDARGRGAQGALMARRISDAVAMGCAHIVTETGIPVGDEPNPSYGNMIRHGFACVHERETWILG